MLRGRGAQVDVAYDGEQALRIHRSAPCDAALVDLKLPLLSGIDVVKSLRSEALRPRVFAMTGYDSFDRIAAAHGAGVERVFRKPFPMDVVINALGLGAAAPERVPDGCRVAVLQAEGVSWEGLRSIPKVDAFIDGDAFREAIAEHAYDAAVILVPPDRVADLVSDLHHLDGDLCVVASSDMEAIADAVEITRRRRSLAHRLERAEALVDRSPLAMLVLDGVPPTITSWNTAALTLLGHRPDELEGLLLVHLEGGGSGALRALVEAARRSETAQARDLQVGLRGGAERLLRAHAWRIPGGEDGVCLALRAPEDDAAAADALSLLGATAAGVAHEMRNTLAGVSASLSVLARRVPEDGDAASVIAKVRERVQRATEVMNDLLDFARPLVLRFLPVPARLVVVAAADQVRDTYPGAEIEMEVADPSLRVLADPVRLQMALVNLGNNAMQAMGGTGKLRFTCRAVPGGVEIVVSDQGPGVPESAREQIFQPFFTTRAAGSGLGLANVRKVVEAHGGHVEVLPIGPGAHIRLLLPPRPQKLREPT